MMLTAYKNFWKNYINFSGRATRTDYWWNVLWTILFAGGGFLVNILYFAALFGGDFNHGIDGNSPLGIFPMIWGGLISVYMLAIFIPWLSLMVRRLRDADFSSLFLLLLILPFLSVMLQRNLLATGLNWLNTALLGISSAVGLTIFLLCQFPTKNKWRKYEY